ncbi:MAG: hypothetical protein JJD92_16355 [Frankiaceae bacterium]|nr:hypothetical protein [Frankiaceae bacterium]
MTVIPAPSDSPAAPAGPPSPLPALESPSPQLTVGPVETANAKPAASTSSGTSRTTKLVVLLLVAAVLLGIGGGYGLWVTSDKR